MKITTTPNTGVLNFKTEPVGATILIDGIEQQGRTPLIVTNIPSGLHEVVIRYPGFEDWNDIIDVVTDIMCCISVDFGTSIGNKSCGTELVPEVRGVAPTKGNSGWIILAAIIGFMFLNPMGS